MREAPLQPDLVSLPTAFCFSRLNMPASLTFPKWFPACLTVPFYSVPNTLSPHLPFLVCRSVLQVSSHFSTNVVPIVLLLWPPTLVPWVVRVQDSLLGLCLSCCPLLSPLGNHKINPRTFLQGDALGHCDTWAQCVISLTHFPDLSAERIKRRPRAFAPVSLKDPWAMAPWQLKNPLEIGPLKFVWAQLMKFCSTKIYRENVSTLHSKGTIPHNTSSSEFFGHWYHYSLILRWTCTQDSWSVCILILQKHNWI